MESRRGFLKHQTMESQLFSTLRKKQIHSVAGLCTEERLCSFFSSPDRENSNCTSEYSSLGYREPFIFHILAYSQIRGRKEGPKGPTSLTFRIQGCFFLFLAADCAVWVWTRATKSHANMGVMTLTRLKVQ